MPNILPSNNNSVPCNWIHKDEAWKETLMSRPCGKCLSYASLAPAISILFKAWANTNIWQRVKTATQDSYKALNKQAISSIHWVAIQTMCHLKPWPQHWFWAYLPYSFWCTQCACNVAGAIAGVPGSLARTTIFQKTSTHFVHAFKLSIVRIADNQPVLNRLWLFKILMRPQITHGTVATPGLGYPWFLSTWMSKLWFVTVAKLTKCRQNWRENSTNVAKKIQFYQNWHIKTTKY